MNFVSVEPYNSFLKRITKLFEIHLYYTIVNIEINNLFKIDDIGMGEIAQKDEKQYP